MTENQHSPRVSPLLAIPFGILAVSTASVFIRFAQAEAVPSLVIAACRLALASLILAPVAFFRHRDELQGLTRGDLIRALFSGIFLAVHFATWITSLEYTTVASSVVFVSTAPLWVALLAPLTIKEPVSRIVLVGMALGLAVPVGGYFLAIPIVLLVLQIPISLNGIGVREAAFILFLGIWGTTEAQAVAYSVVIFAMIVLQGGLVGGTFFALRRRVLGDLDTHQVR